jgi:hypothetical protein
MDRRTEEQKLRGIVPILWGGEIREVPTLKRGPSRAWKESLGKALGAVSGLTMTDMDSLASVGNVLGDQMFDLVRQYDQTGVLGDAEWIDQHVDDLEIYQAFRDLLEISYPFVTDLRGVLAEVRTLGLAVASQSVSQDSMNTPSPSGVSTPRKSTRG